MLVAGIPLPRHGFRHLLSPQPCFTFPPRTDSQIVPESAASSYSVGSFQISVKQELAKFVVLRRHFHNGNFFHPHLQPRVRAIAQHGPKQYHCLLW